MKTLIRLLSHLTGGRPMQLIEGSRFQDIVNGQQVNLYKDQFGRTYLAHSAWSRFRVGINPTVDD